MSGNPLDPSPVPYILVTQDKDGVRAEPHCCPVYMPWSPALGSIFFSFPDRVEVTMEALKGYEKMMTQLTRVKTPTHWVAIWIKVTDSDHVEVEVKKAGGVTTWKREAEYVFSGWRTENRNGSSGESAEG